MVNASSHLLVSKKKAVVLLFSLYAFILSLIVLPFAIHGDQEHYIAFYNALPGLSFFEGYIAQKNMLGSSEPGYFIFSYLSSVVLNVDRVLVFAALNTILAALIINWIANNRVSILVICLISINFYLLVLFFSAERLKLAFIFFVLYLTYLSSFRVLFLVGSIFTHVQLVVFLISKAILDSISSLKILANLKLNRKVVSVLFMAFLGVSLLVLLQEHLMGKMEYYISHSSVLGLFKVLLFMLMSLYYAWPKRLEIFALFIPILVFTAFFGGERFAILGYFVFMFYGLQVSRGLNLGVIATSSYFAVKGILFLDNVFVYGDGFYR